MEEDVVDKTNLQGLGTIHVQMEEDVWQQNNYNKKVSKTLPHKTL